MNANMPNDSNVHPESGWHFCTWLLNSSCYTCSYLGGTNANMQMNINYGEIQPSIPVQNVMS